LRLRPALLLDFGCGNGRNAETALAASARMVVGFSADQPALDEAVRRADEKKLAFLPLYRPPGRVHSAQSAIGGVPAVQGANAALALGRFQDDAATNGVASAALERVAAKVEPGFASQPA
jgi:ribosomal protein L11 methylase PrmA